MVRRVAAVVVLAGLLVACSGSSEDSAPTLRTSPPAPSTEATTSSSTASDSTTTSVAPAGPERCQGSAVGITFVDKRAALGTSLTVFEIRNRGAGTCRVEGHPGVEALDAAGRVLATARRRAGAIVSSAPPKPVTIPAGGAAYFAVESQNVCSDDAPPADSDRLRVVLPENASSVEVTGPITVCPRAEIVVSPVRASQDQLAGE